MNDTKDLIREIQEHIGLNGIEDTATHLLVQAAAALQRHADELAAIGAGGVSGPLLGEAQSPAVPAVQGDPLDWPLPCDITAGGVTIGKGCPLRTVQTRLQVQSEGAALLFKRIRELSPQAEAQAAPDCLTCNDHGAVGNILTAEPCPDCTSAPQPEAQAPAVLGEIELIEKAAKRVGITSLLNHGAASCVYSDGCAGVSQEHLLAYTREIALHCAVALAAQGGV